MHEQIFVYIFAIYRQHVIENGLLIETCYSTKLIKQNWTFIIIKTTFDNIYRIEIVTCFTFLRIPHSQ